MNLERSKQLTMLKALAEVYPRYTIDIVEVEASEDDLANLWYLKEQGLIEGALDMSTTGAYIFEGAKITAKGLDFLADDGGISAILGTVTVRLHADSIKELLLTKVESSSASTEKKTWLKKQIETASGETIKKIVGSLIDQGVKYGPDFLQWAEKSFQTIKTL